MSTVTSTYNRNSVLENDPQYALRAAMERFTKSRADEIGAKKNDDQVALSDHGRALAALSARSREELEGLSYEPLLRFEDSDGTVLTVDLALEGEEGEEMYTAARITIARPDGTGETLYVSGGAKAEETTEEESAQAPPAGDETREEAVAESEPSLMELIEQYGLNKTADATEGLLAAIRARVEAMLKAAEETAEETEALEEVKAEREARSERASGTGAAGDGGQARETRLEGGSTGASRARTLSSYTRNAAASFTSGMGKFSRHY